MEIYKPSATLGSAYGPKTGNQRGEEDGRRPPDLRREGGANQDGAGSRGNKRLGGLGERQED